MSGTRCLILVRGVPYKISTGAREVTDVQIKLFQTDTVNEHTFYVIIVTLRVNLIICLPLFRSLHHLASKLVIFSKDFYCELKNECTKLPFNRFFY